MTADRVGGLPRRQPGEALRAVERALGRALAGPAGQPGGPIPRRDWARVYWLFECEFGLRSRVSAMLRPPRRGGPRHRR